MKRQILKIALVAVPAAVLSALVITAIAPPAQAQTNRARLQPFVLQSGQTVDDFYAFFVLDPDSQKLAVLAWDRGKNRLEAVGGRDLAKDFNAEFKGTYSMASVQLTGSRGLLCVINHPMERAVVYEVDTTKGLNPRSSVDLADVFKLGK